MAKTMEAKLQLNIDAQIEETCTKIRNAIISTEVSSEMTSECERFISQLEGPLGVAVRSSSNQEDSLGKAFAGQFETHLNVPKHPKGKAPSNLDYFFLLMYRFRYHR
jgi:phosphoenolpyruvate synthase/pyruvate phosphate dikinase